MAAVLTGIGVIGSYYLVVAPLLHDILGGQVIMPSESN